MSFAAASALFQCAGDVELRGLERGDDAEKNAGKRRDAESERQDAIINPDLVESRCAFGNDRDKQIREPDAQEQSGNTANRGKQNALGEHLPNDSFAAGPQRGADRNFLLPRGATGEEEIGYVRAGNQQHESDGTEEREEGWFYLANEPFVERRNRHVPAFVRLVKLLVELRIDGAETSLRLLQIDTGVQTRDRRPYPVIARFVPRVDRGRHPNLGLLRVFKPRRHHADNRERE